MRISTRLCILYVLSVLLINRQVACFAPISSGWLQLTKNNYDNDRPCYISLKAKVDLEEETQITADSAVVDECVFQDIEVGCIDLLMGDLTEDLQIEDTDSSSWSYGEFAKTYPNVNNIGIATIKTASADLLAQVAIAHTPVSDIDWQRAFLFCAFGATYLGAFQYWYQVNIFKKLFDVDKFTSQPWSDKLKDTNGLKSLAAQTAVDLTVLTFVYLPTFYVFKSVVFSGSADPSIWLSSGLDKYSTNFAKDEFDLIRVWAPADLVCFSVPLYLRLPVRHVVSFVWTAYLSFSRGGH